MILVGMMMVSVEDGDGVEDSDDVDDVNDMEDGDVVER